MARNRKPEETRRKILEVSKDLFLEKGFDNTSIQDIIDGLGGLTKGVIYHHFESKDEILQSILSENNQEILNYNWRGDTALEKIQNSLMDAFSDFEQQRLVYSASIMLRSPRLLGEQYLNLFSDFLPEIREKVFEGVEDKSIKDWQTRKELQLAKFREVAEDESLRKVLLVTFSDKLANLMELYQDYLIIGDLLWDRFNSKDPKKQLWYFNEFYKIFKDNKDLFSKNEEILDNYREILNLLFYNN